MFSASWRLASHRLSAADTSMRYWRVLIWRASRQLVTLTRSGALEPTPQR